MLRLPWFRPHVPFFEEFSLFLRFLYRYTRLRGYRWFSRFEAFKDVIVDLLYKKRGKYARPFLHFGTIGLTFLVITFGPYILEERRREEEAGITSSGLTTQTFAYGDSLDTVESQLVKDLRGGEVVTHRVAEGETLSTIAEKYGLEVETILWENNLPKNAKLKPGDELRILPEDGVRHKVARGETIYTIGKKYGLEDEADAQRIVNYPFNEFKNAETFELAIGQTIMVPGGVKPDEPTTRPVARTGPNTPNRGTVAATGRFAWPAQGRITQGFRAYHPGYDIANKGGGPIVAADSGTIAFSGWDASGYGNKVMINHGNGYVTLYAHMSVLQVRVGQTVNRGDVVGQMGSTGRSTGTHLHFEIHHGSVRENPANHLR